MTIRGFWLALALIGSEPTEAASCHRYSVWRYPTPQHCGAQAQYHARAIPRIVPEMPPERDIPLPTLSIDDYGAGRPDEVTQARLELLGYAYAH